nr:RNA methyltransferase [Thiofilum flexile]
MMSVLDNLCIVMVQTSHPGNIGAAARAMKTMGVSDLRLVQPKDFNSPQTKAMASGADSILESAKHTATLHEALADCQIVIGTSARSERSLAWPQLVARECGEFVASQLTGQKVALVFGRERTGLTNEELAQCQYLTHIPMAVDYYSLNIAAAIQLYCYECSQAVRALDALPNVQVEGLGEPLATGAQLEGLYEHLEQTLVEVRYLDPDNPRLLMSRLRRLFGRTHLTQSELNILRGILAAFQGRKFRPRV